MSEPEVFYCRLCANLKSMPDVVFINKDGGITRKIYEKVLECFQLNRENSFPSSVCPDCWVQATSMYDLYKKVLHAQDILRHIQPNHGDTKTIKLEIEEEITDSANMKNEVEFGKENYLDLDYKDGEWSDCKNDIEIEDDEWNKPLSSIKKDALVKDEITNQKKEDVNKNTDRIKKYKKKRDVSTRNLKENKTTKKLKKQHKGQAEEWKDYVFYCTLCTNNFEKVTELQKHFEDKHDNKPTEYKCMDCDSIMTKYPSFRRHVKNHRGKIKFWCQPCNKSFQVNSKLQRHMKFVHGPGDIERSLCPICGKSFRSSYLAKHKRYAHIPEDQKCQFECEICHKKVSSFQSLKSHKKVHEDSREHTCEHCGVAFRQQGNLKQHIIQKHTDLKDLEMVKCPACPKMFKHKFALRKHLKIHMVTELYHCEVCDRAFKHKFALTRHATIHTNLLPFECEYCKKCFRQKMFLKIHLRQHTGEKPYSCIECNQRFTNDSNFIKHIRGKHGLKQFSIANQNQFPFVNK